MQVFFKCPFCGKSLVQQGQLVIECQCPESIQHRYLVTQQQKPKVTSFRELRKQRKREKAV